MKKVLTSGTFDLLHYGHINLLRRAKVLGDYLIVACSTDDCAETKEKKCYFNYDVRADMLQSIRYVDMVIPETSSFDEALFGLLKIIKQYHIDIFVLGSDYKDELVKMKGYQEFCQNVQIVYLERTPEISTTTIKTYLEIAKTDNDCKNIF
jgi:glycerol-3-phosphate cytidylyltransferase